MACNMDLQLLMHDFTEIQFSAPGIWSQSQTWLLKLQPHVAGKPAAWHQNPLLEVVLLKCRTLQALYAVRNTDLLATWVFLSRWPS